MATPAFCTSCGDPLTPGARFCSQCGAKVAVAPAAPSGERREVSILFADLSGFTRLSTQLDPEELHGVLQRYFGEVDGLVARHGGTVDKHIGDCVMAVFGAPVAHPDDPERAVRCAIGVHEAMTRLSAATGLELRAHVGIASGQVVASGLGSTSFQEYTVIGDSVNLAARLQDKAKAGETVVSDAVRRAVGARLEAVGVGEVEVKGLDKPVRVWKVAGLVEAPALRIVGRDREIAHVVAALDRARAGQGSVVVVRGEPGIGKTRLVEAIRERASADGFDVHVGHVLDFGGAPQDAVRTIARGLLGGSVDDAVAAGRLRPDDVPFANDLLGVPQGDVWAGIDERARQQGREDVLCRLTTSAVHRDGDVAGRPRLVVVEDVHWTDATARRHLAAVARACRETSAVLLLTSRPEPMYEWEPADVVELAPLGADAALDLARQFPEAAAVAAACVARAEGNPLFLEQLLRCASEGSLDGVPGTVHSIVLARADRLGPVDRRALRLASVFGQRFPAEAVAALLSEPSWTPATLLQHRLVNRDGDELRFAHALVRDGVYESLLKATRKELHKDVAGWYRGRDPALVALHLDRAESEDAAAAYLEAARVAVRDHRDDVAIELGRRGREIARTSTERAVLGRLIGETCLAIARLTEAEATFREVIAQAPDPVDVAKARIGLAGVIRQTSSSDEIVEQLALAEPIVAAAGLDGELARIHYLRGSFLFVRGDNAGCGREHALGLDAARRAGDREYEGRTLSGLGDADYASARYSEGLAKFEASNDVYLRHGLRRLVPNNLHIIANCLVYLGRVQEARELTLRCIEEARQYRNVRAEMFGWGVYGQVLIELGEHDEAALACARAADLAQRTRSAHMIGFVGFLDALVAAHRGDVRGARERIAPVAEVMRHVRSFQVPLFEAVSATLTDDAEERRAALSRVELAAADAGSKEGLLQAARYAVEASWKAGDVDGLERYAAQLERFRAEAGGVPWALLHASRARALAASLRGDADAGERLDDVAGRLRSAGMLDACRAVDEARRAAG